jgi:hypothetical protein
MKQRAAGRRTRTYALTAVLAERPRSCLQAWAVVWWSYTHTHTPRFGSKDSSMTALDVA